MTFKFWRAIMTSYKLRKIQHLENASEKLIVEMPTAALREIYGRVARELDRRECDKVACPSTPTCPRDQDPIDYDHRS